MSSNFLKKHKTNTCLEWNIKTKKNIKKIENTIDSIIVTLYNIDKLDEGTETLISYDTPIIERTADGKLNRLWFGDWTATTGRHIKSFCGLNKKQFMEL